MKSLAIFFSRARRADQNPELIHSRNGETSGGGAAATAPTDGETAPSGERETIAAVGDGDRDERSSPGEGENKRELMDKPPSDDVCPICFGDFDVPCRAPCGHWYCGGCILQYWNFSAALRPCKCPMCSQLITKLTPEASFCNRPEVEISKVLRNVGDYNRLFVGGICGFMLKFLAIPLYMKRMFREMLNPDRPGLYLHEMRMLALFLGVLYSLTPFDFLRIGHRNIIDVFDYSAFALSFVFYLVGAYLRRRRRRNVRELIDLQEVQD
ncbi:RING/U-box superfamily protein [Striga asiatica]|uniref:RING/U-box superfamily protein n=1 Tax=Striga asiatica TaxID=4170 RepID=A0A5A7P2D1_STRAF|nr:RING/U-box superfamily protein [Striga asiatica]